MDLIESIQSKLDGNLLDRLKQEIGADSEEQTEAGANAVITALVAGLSRNAQQPEGAQSLNNALERDHDGGLFDDLVGNLFGNRTAPNPKTFDGAGILQHILGNKQPVVGEAVGKATGLDKSQILKLMMSLAPIVLGMLGKAKKNKGLGSFELSDLLKGTMQKQVGERKEAGLLNRLLDSDGDGSIMDDIANLGRNAFLSRRK
jgi:hypothetical protein